MATPIQQLKGTAAEVAAKIYAQGLLVWNETAKRWHGGDGVTLGGIAMARFDERNDGSLGYEQRLETAASNAVTVADIGKAIVGNRATAIAFNLDPAASLTGKFVAVFKNINTGAMTVVPNGAELIDGVNAAISVPTGSSVIIKGDGTSFRTFLANGDVTGAAINGASALTGANLADNDKLGIYDTSAAALASMTITEFVAGIFKTARKIANGNFLSSLRIWDAADNTKGLAFSLTGIATATTRTITLPDADVTLGTSISLAASVATNAGTSIDFTGIPASAKRVTLNLYGISTNGTSDLLVQGGTSGGVENSGYGGAVSRFAASALATSSVSSGLNITGGDVSAADLYYGKVIFEKVSGNLWTAYGNLAKSGGAAFSVCGKTFAAALDRVRLTTAGGANSFDAGTASISWET